METFRKCRLFVHAVVLLAASSCHAADTNAGRTLTYDSAGIEMVVNPRPVIDSIPSWRLAENPRLRIGSDERPGHDLFRVTGGVLLESGRIAILNTGSAEVHIYSSNGELLTVLGRKGRGPGELQVPYGLFRLSGEDLVVWDAALSRLGWVVDGRELTGSHAVPGELPPNSYVLGSDPRGALFFSVRFVPSGDAMIRSGTYWYYSFTHRSLDSIYGVSLPPLHRVGGIRMGPILAPKPIATMDLQGRVYVGGVAASDPAELRVVDREGALLRVIRFDVGPQRVTRRHVARQIDRLLSRFPEGERAAARRAIEELPRAERLPAFDEMRADRSGHLWLRRHTVSQADSVEWIVAGSRGHVVGRVVMPGRLQPLDIGSDYVLGRMLDDMDVEYIHLYDLVRH